MSLVSMLLPDVADAQEGDRALVYCGSGPACFHGFDGITDAFVAGGAAGVDVWTDVMPNNPDLSPYRIILYYWPSDVWPTELRIHDYLRNFHDAGGVIIAASGYADTLNEMNDLAYRLGLTTRVQWVSFVTGEERPVDPAAHALLDGVSAIFVAPLGLMSPNGGTTLAADADGNPLIVVEDRVIFSISSGVWSDTPGGTYPHDSEHNPGFWENIWRFYAVSKIDNGDFETGAADDWTIIDLEGPTNDTFYVWSGTDTPNTGFGDGYTPGPSGGSYFALSDPAAASTSALIQTFSLARDHHLGTARLRPLRLR